jgi:hypothetical protein
MDLCGGGIDERMKDDRQVLWTTSFEEWERMSWPSLEMRVHDIDIPFRGSDKRMMNIWM